MKPHIKQIWPLVIQLKMQFKQYLQSIAILNKMIARDGNNELCLISLARCQCQLDQLDESIKAYQRVISINPRSASTYNEIGIVFKRQGKQEETLRAYEKALDIDPNFFEVYYNKAILLQEQRNLTEAMNAYQNAINIKPDYIEAWLNGAEALEKWNKLDDLQQWLEKAYQAFEKTPAFIKYYQAKLLWRTKKIEEALLVLVDIKVEDVSDNLKQDYFHLLGKLYEKIGSFEKAHFAFSEMNLLAKKSPEYERLQPQRYFESLTTALDDLKVHRFSRPTVQKVSITSFRPVFLVGFPRSGTTLLDSMLRSHSAIEVVEEKPALANAKSFLEKKGCDDFIGSVPQWTYLTEARKIYETEFLKHISNRSQATVYIDKLPLNLLYVPLIHSLFPDAKYILALRHPLDVILSCWMQNFKLNSAMANMLELDQITRFYTVAMETFDLCRTRYNLSVHEIKYENLIKDQNRETSDLLAHIGLNWQAGMANYQLTALNRGRIDTPSYSQVIQPIYKDSCYKWVNFETHLRKYMGKIEPWLKKFHYS